VNKLVNRVFCRECGAIRIRQGRSSYAVCPNGHGRLVPRFSTQERRQAITARLPCAYRIKRNEFVIDGHNGRFAYRNGNGRRATRPDEGVQVDEVLARHVLRKRTMIRIFARKPPWKKDIAGKAE
jgi:hypothetical protein